MPRRHDGHILEGAVSRRWRSDSSKAKNPTTTSRAATQLGKLNDSALARRERQGNEPDDDIDDGATHLGTDSSPARRERQRNEPNDDVDDGATHLGTWNDSTPARRERQRNEPDDDIDGGAAHLGKLNDNALRLLQIMGRRGSWTSDLLFERSALPFPELQHAILLLELEGRARRRGCEIDAV
jgi:hypothetical protein